MKKDTTIIIVLVIAIIILVSALTVKVLNTNKEKEAIQDYENLNAEDIDKIIKEIDILITQFEGIEDKDFESLKNELKVIKKDLEKLKEKNNVSKNEIETVIKKVNDVKQKCADLEKK